MMAIQHTDFTIHGSNVVVLGFGRIGMSVARTFHLLGSKVKVGARSRNILLELRKWVYPFHLQDIEKEVGNTDIFINTIPHFIVTANVISKMPAHTSLLI